MKTIGLCTHFSQTDEWAFEYALGLARARDWQLNICHWLSSPYSLRRDQVYSGLNDHSRIETATPGLINRLELELREYYEAKLGDFTQVAFKLCEGQYQVELVRCFRQHLLDLVVMGYQATGPESASSELPLPAFARHLTYPLILVGPDHPKQFHLNPPAIQLLDELNLPEGSWMPVDAVGVV